MPKQRKECQFWLEGNCKYSAYKCNNYHRLANSAGCIILMHCNQTRKTQIVVVEKPRCKTEIANENILIPGLRQASSARSPSGHEFLVDSSDANMFNLAIEEAHQETGIPKNILKANMCSNDYIAYEYDDGKGIHRTTRYYVVHFLYNESEEHPKKWLKLDHQQGISELTCYNNKKFKFSKGCQGTFCMDGCDYNCNHLCDCISNGDSQCTKRHGIHLWSIEKWAISRQQGLFVLLEEYLQKHKCF